MPQLSDTSQCKRWLFPTAEALRSAREAAYAAAPVLTQSLRYKQDEYPLKNASPCFINYMLAGQIINPHQTMIVALCDLNNERTRNLGRFVVSSNYNEVISLSIFARQFITVGIKKYPEIQTAYRRMMQRFAAFKEDLLHKSFLYYQVKTAEILARRMTCFLNVSLIHPLSPLLISLLLSFKVGSCDYFQRRETYVSRLYDARYITDSPYLFEACGIRNDDPTRDIKLRTLNKETGELFSEMHRMMKKHELYLLQKLDFSVYCVLADDFIDDSFVALVLESTAVSSLREITYEIMERELEFILTATRLTDCYLLCKPDTIAVFCIIEGALLYTQRHQSTVLEISREQIYQNVTAASSDNKLNNDLQTIRETLFYFISGSIPNVPQDIVEAAGKAAKQIMPMDTCEFRPQDYIAFLQEHFSFRVVMIKDD